MRAHVTKEKAKHPVWADKATELKLTLIMWKRWAKERGYEVEREGYGQHSKTIKVVNPLNNKVIKVLERN